MALFEVSFTILDIKNHRSVMTIYVNAPPAISDPRDDPAEYAQEYARLIDPLINGQIVGIRISQIVTVPGGIKTSPLSTSDVEEGALFTWRTTNNTIIKQRIPTFSETFVSPGTFFVDITDPDVSDFIELNVIPEELPADWTVGPASYRGEDISSLQEARENFTKSRKPKRQ